MKLKKFKLKDGYLIVDSDFIVCKKPKEANYAGVVEDKNGTIPHYIIFSDKPIHTYSIEEVNAVYEELGRIYPAIEKIRVNEVPPKYVNGTFVNEDDWINSSELNLYEVREVGDKWHLYLGAGIIRKGKHHGKAG